MSVAGLSLGGRVALGLLVVIFSCLGPVERLQAGGRDLCGDANGDSLVDLGDAVHVLTWLFRGGAPHANGEECVRIPTCPESCSD